MIASASIRHAHRWLGIAFTACVIANFAVRPWGEPPALLTYSPLAPLFLLLLPGLYMFVSPYLRRRRSPVSATGNSGFA